MPLKVTIELIPFGDKKKKKKLAEVDIVNNLKGTPEKGNYDVKAKTFDYKIYTDPTTDRLIEIAVPNELERKDIKGIKRGNILYTVAECLRKLIK